MTRLVRPRCVSRACRARRVVRWRRRACAALVLALLAHDHPAPVARGGKSVFSSQPIEWDPEFRKNSKVPPIRFSVAWTYDGFHAPLAGDPVSVGDLLVVAGQDGNLAALDAAGKALWTVRLPSEIAVGPAARGATLLVAARGGSLSAFGARDGRPLWQTDLGSDALFPPLTGDATALVAVEDQALLAIDIADGSITARLPLPGRPSTPPEPAPGGIVIGTEHGMLVAADLPDLRIRWRRYLGSAVTAPPLVHRKRVYVATADRRLTSLRQASGRPVWATSTGAIVAARPFTEGPWLYLLCYDDDIYALNARNGHLMTRVRMGHRLDRDAALTREHLFVAPFTEAAIVGLALPGLQSAGTYALNIPGEWFTTAPIVVADRVVVGYGREEGRVLALTVGPAAPATTAAPAAGR